MIIGKEFKFEAAHRLPSHDGKCRRLHGHSWVMEVFFAGGELIAGGPKAGMLADYSDIKALITPIVDKYLDHHYLNQSLNLPNPTSEQIGLKLIPMIKRRLSRSKLRDQIHLHSIRIKETCTSSFYAFAHEVD